MYSREKSSKLYLSYLSDYFKNKPHSQIMRNNEEIVNDNNNNNEININNNNINNKKYDEEN